MNCPFCPRPLIRIWWSRWVRIYTIILHVLFRLMAFILASLRCLYKSMRNLLEEAHAFCCRLSWLLSSSKHVTRSKSSVEGRLQPHLTEGTVCKNMLRGVNPPLRKAPTTRGGGHSPEKHVSRSKFSVEDGSNHTWRRALSGKNMLRGVNPTLRTAPTTLDVGHSPEKNMLRGVNPPLRTAPTTLGGGHSPEKTCYAE